MLRFGKVDAFNINDENSRNSLIKNIPENHNVSEKSHMRVARDKISLIHEYFGLQTLALLGIPTPSFELTCKTVENWLTKKQESILYMDTKKEVRYKGKFEIGSLTKRAINGLRADKSLRLGPLAECVINDRDGMEYFPVKHQERLYRLAFDRECVSTTEVTEEQITTVRNNDIYLKAASKEELIAFKKQLEAIIKNGLLKAVFNNSRVVHTKEFQEERPYLEKLEAAWTKNIQTIIINLNKVCAAELNGFDYRENLRQEIVDQIIGKLKLNIDCMETVKQEIMDDLRSTYYLELPHMITEKTINDSNFMYLVFQKEQEKQDNKLKPSDAEIKNLEEAVTQGFTGTVSKTLESWKQKGISLKPIILHCNSATRFIPIAGKNPILNEEDIDNCQDIDKLISYLKVFTAQVALSKIAIDGIIFNSTGPQDITFNIEYMVSEFVDDMRAINALVSICKELDLDNTGTFENVKVDTKKFEEHAIKRTNRKLPTIPQGTAISSDIENHLMSDIILPPPPVTQSTKIEFIDFKFPPIPKEFTSTNQNKDNKFKNTLPIKQSNNSIQQNTILPPPPNTKSSNQPAQINNSDKQNFDLGLRSFNSRALPPIPPYENVKIERQHKILNQGKKPQDPLSSLARQSNRTVYAPLAGAVQRDRVARPIVGAVGEQRKAPPPAPVIKPAPAVIPVPAPSVQTSNYSNGVKLF